MKLLVVTSSYPRREGDIAGRFVLEWVEHLERLGHTVRVLTWHDGQGGVGWQPDTHKVVRVRYAPTSYETLFYGAGTPENLRENPARGLLAAPAGVAMAAAMARQVTTWRPDVLVGHWLVPSGVLVRAVGRLFGLPSLVVGHSGGVHLLDGLPRAAGRALAGFVTRGPTTIPSLELAEKLRRLTPKAEPGDLHVLPMGFEPPDEQIELGAERVLGQKQDWLCIGRLVEIKGVDLAIEAFAAADWPDATTLHIAGNGPKRAELERLAARLHANVDFHGVVTGEAKQQLFERCGFALFCSKELPSGRHEGLPVSFLEASAQGLIPLCASIPGLSDYLVDRDLQHLDSRGTTDWARAIERLANLSADERADHARRQRRAVAHLQWPRLATHWDALLRSIAHKF
ncbi:MAG: glycosyltransferase family 4 protein [Persicimonas sp.]